MDRSAGPARQYDAARRRDRAHRERQETRRRVVDAATALFVERGYTRTTVADIAREAGVALQSVYKAGGSKAQLLHLVVDRAVAGDDEDVLFHQRPPFASLAEARDDPARQVRTIADLIAQTQERSSPVQTAYREAAATDPAVAASFAAAHDRRHETFALAIGLIEPSALRLTPAACTDTLWAIGSPEVFYLLRTLRGWTATAYRQWLADELISTLLAHHAVPRDTRP